MLESGRDAIGYAAVLGISELQNFWLNLARAVRRSARPTSQRDESVPAGCEEKIGSVGGGSRADTCRNGQVITAEFCAAVDGLGMLTSRQKELTIHANYDQNGEAHSKRGAATRSRSAPLSCYRLGSHFFRGSDANMSTRSSNRCSRSARDFVFSLTEKGKRYGETKESEVKISKRIRLRKDMASRRAVKISARVLEAPVTRFN